MTAPGWWWQNQAHTPDRSNATVVLRSCLHPLFAAIITQKAIPFLCKNRRLYFFGGILYLARRSRPSLTLYPKPWPQLSESSRSGRRFFYFSLKHTAGQKASLDSRPIRQWWLHTSLFAVWLFAIRVCLSLRNDASTCCYFCGSFLGNERTISSHATSWPDFYRVHHVHSVTDCCPFDIVTFIFSYISSCFRYDYIDPGTFYILASSFLIIFFISAFLHLCIWLLYCFSLTFSCFFILFVFVSTLIQGPPPNAGRTGAAHVNVEPKPEQGLGERAAAPNERELTRCRTSTVAENTMPGWSHIFGDKLLEISMG